MSSERRRGDEQLVGAVQVGERERARGERDPELAADRCDRLRAHAGQDALGGRGRADARSWTANTVLEAPSFTKPS